MDILQWILLAQGLVIAGLLLREALYKDGVMSVTLDEDGVYIYGLVLEHDPESLRKKRKIVFKVVGEALRDA
jgi:hypothetical protein